MSIEDGGMLTEEYNEDTPNYDVRGILKYCKENGIEPKELDDDTRNKFIRD